MSPRPTEIRYRREDRVLAVAFDDGATFDLPAELLRVESPSAEIQGHGPGQKTTIGGKRSVGIARIEPVGHYAVRIAFDDGHDSGLFTWDWLYGLGARQAEIWAAYEAALAAKGLTRDPPLRRR
ncbi:MAG: gamma-butyrobetaine hydroxylase-like domain-containing protein [Rhodospirillales bacterium]|jgi:DUF971 family protein